MADTERSRSPRPPRADTFPGAWTLVRVRDVPIRVDISWIAIAGLVVFFLFTQFTELLGGYGTPVAVGAAVLAAALFFASLLGHELGHAWTSLDRGIPVTGVTLFLLGGVTESTREARTAKDEFVIVGIGPFISLVLAAAFGLAYTVVADFPVPAAIAGYLAWINLMLGVFNLVPAYPLDGGRLLRSILWGVVGNPHRATRWAARVGQLFAGALIAYGIWTFVQLGGRGFGGIWEVLIGLFLFRGAAQSHAQARVRGQLATQRVGDVMGSVPPALAGHERLSDAVVAVQERPSVLWPVGSPLQGGLTLERIDAVPRGDWALKTVADIALPAEDVTVPLDVPMDVALDRMAAAPGSMLIVVDGGRPVGLLTPSLVSGHTR